MQETILQAVTRNEEWRGRQCINLLAPEAPTTPTVRALLSAEVGIRAAEGHVGSVNRWFAGTKYIDEIESLCIELLKQVFHARYADHRLVASMIGNMVVYASMTQPDDTIMTVAQPFGGHSSNRQDGPAGVRGLQYCRYSIRPHRAYRRSRPLPRARNDNTPQVGHARPLDDTVSATGAVRQIVGEWGGDIYFDGAHQLGLIAGGQFQDPLTEGAAVLTGSAGKTFSGPQSGVIVWNNERLTKPLTTAIFPVMAATHQVNRVAALAASAVDMLAFGQRYMAQIVRNAQALGAALQRKGIPMLGSHKGFTQTHQTIADVRQFGGGLAVAQRLARANIITNKNLIPSDLPADWDRPGGLRMGAIEVTRLGMHEPEMEQIADFIARVLVDHVEPEALVHDVTAFREPYQTLYYCVEHGLPPHVAV